MVTFPQNDELIILESRFHELSQQSCLGITGHGGKKMNKIRTGLMYIINNISEEDLCKIKL